MTHCLRSMVVVALALAAAVLAVPGTASAEPTAVGYDVSYPQCDDDLPRNFAFGVVGVNGGTATRANACLTDQLRWADRASGTMAAQPATQLYLNTANPGELRTQVSTWPTSGATPYGNCTGDNDTACSWQYGWERVRHSVTTFFGPAAASAEVDASPAEYTWWLDVETTNTWQSGSADALARNRATLEGMTAYLVSRGGRVGVYSTHEQWDRIAGTVGSGSVLAGRPSWLAGATTLTGARSNCAKSPLVPGGRVTLTQYVVKDLDRNHSCT
jgi:hypothetical protein